MPGYRPPHQVKPKQVTNYHASYTLSKLHLSTAIPHPFAQLRGVMGPLGSGKTVGCSWELMQLAIRMPPNEDAIRRSRWAVIRNTYRELEDSTLQTWLDWFPEENFGQFLRRGMTHKIRRPLPDSTKLELDVMFRALDRPQDVRKLLSVEYTGAFVNEARESPRAIIDMLRNRVGRFPPWGSVPPYWHGILMDTNPPDETSWWYEYAEKIDWSADHALIDELKRRGYEITPADLAAGFVFWRQPSGRSPKAENLDHLSPGYYATGGRSADWIKVYIDGEYGYIQTGLPVYPEFYEQIHYKPDLRPIRAAITVGLDFGLTPAAVFVQQDARGRYLVIDELCAQDLGITKFSKLLAKYIAQHYQGYEFTFVGDPSGDQRSAIDEEDTVFKVMRKHGINARPCFTQDWIMRRDAIGVPLEQLSDGQPGIMIGPRAQMVRQGLGGKYRYKELNLHSMDEQKRYHEIPDKNDWSHPCEALQYALLSMGSNPMKPKPRGAQPTTQTVIVPHDFDLWNARVWTNLPGYRCIVPATI